MNVIMVYLFIAGLFFGSFYNCIAHRLSKNESIIRPGSHCENCKHELNWYELIPVFSYMFLRGRCKKCKTKLSIWYPLTEIITGMLFALSYYFFGFTFETLISITIVSILIITFISDINYYVILDEVIAIGLILLIVLMYFNAGFNGLIKCMIGALFLGVVMLLIKLIGDRAFKTESLGWGDVKLSIIAGFILGIRLGVLYIFLASLIALPIAFIFSIKNKSNVIPFGPFLSISLLLIYWFSPFFYSIINILIGV
jgi:leader peptidase (prepilin peptidase)/N-methyltransferase